MPPIRRSCPKVRISVSASRPPRFAICTFREAWWAPRTSSTWLSSDAVGSRSKKPDGETQYTRAGAFNTNADGQLVTIDGYTVVPGVVFPDDTSEVVISVSGQIFARIGNDPEMQDLGQLTLANFVNEAGLEPLGDNLFRETPASGPAIVGIPNDPGFASIQQGYLEASNVDPVKEITDLISAQRAYEMNSKIIQAADEMASVVSKNLR